jgi:mevalonate pyrophosphate decarboxylase
MRSGVLLAHGGREIAGGEQQISKAAKNEAGLAALRSETPEAPGLVLVSAREFFGGIFHESTTRAASALAMAVQRLKQLPESSPKAQRTKPTAAYYLGPSLEPNS